LDGKRREEGAHLLQLCKIKGETALKESGGSSDKGRRKSYGRKRRPKIREKGRAGPKNDPKRPSACFKAGLEEFGAQMKAGRREGGGWDADQNKAELKEKSCQSGVCFQGEKKG